MAHYADDTYENDSAPSAEDIQGMMVAKAHELFALCDVEHKGFITKRDMQRLQTELPLTPEQLEDVFDSLDDDGNGFLTLEEFTDGFGSFLGLTARPDMEQQQSVDSSVGSGERVYENDHVDSEGEEEQFTEMLDNLNANGVLEDQEVIRSLWQRLRREEPELLGSFEEFLGRVSGEIRRTHQDYMSLESALKNKTNTHDEEVQKLYEEMENQIKLEKERILAEEKARERQVREELEAELREKDRQLQELQNRHHETVHKLEDVNSNETEYKSENDRLGKEKSELEELLDHSMRDLDDSRQYISQLRSQTREDKRDRALAALQISEGIAMERESLVKQLDMLRDMNKKLRDDRDEAELRRGAGNLGAEMEEAMQGETAPSLRRAPSDEVDASPISLSLREDSKKTAAKRRQLSKQGSVLSNYFSNGVDSRQNSVYDSDGIECDDDVPMYTGVPPGGDHGLLVAEEANSLSAELGAEFMSGQRRYSSTDEEGDGGSGARRKRRPSPRHRSIEEEPEFSSRYDAVERSLSTESEFDIQSPRVQPVGANSTTETTDKMSTQEIEAASPERLFKVVFVGDSGVGKSSFIHQFCSKNFKATFSATIGVDFQVKNLKVDGHVVALQLWDTAGQERFRSITKQYFRKADGVIIAYDVTSESSFKSVRNWMTSVQEGTDDDTVLMVIGNKMDLVEDDDRRPVTTKDGSRLADEYGALFFETSAKSGVQVYQSLAAMASLLREKEDQNMEKALDLSKNVEKERTCCF